MYSFENINFVVAENGIATLTINRPTKLNALNVATIEEIRLATDLVADQEHIKGLLITGSGEKAFIAGADIAEIAALPDGGARKFSESGQKVFEGIENLNKPVIAAINGFCLGGGAEVAMACHLRLAVASAKIGMPEINLGLLPGYGGTQRLARYIGKTKAMEMILTGEPITAKEALDLGLLNHVLETHAELMAKAEELMLKIVTKAPIAIGHIIDCVNAYYDDHNGFQAESNSFGGLARTEDFREGVSAFLEKRKPVFKNK
jgi:enoyl-CoA hydratase